MNITDGDVIPGTTVEFAPKPENALWIMTLRDYFAAAAMQGMLADAEGESNDSIARYSYDLADAMIREREKP